jgi:hypothetical protein
MTCWPAALPLVDMRSHRRPWQHSASWWPRLFAGDDSTEIAWDDETKDYSDLPPAVAAAADATEAEEAAARRVDALRNAARQPIADALERHSRVRFERLRKLRSAAREQSNARQFCAELSAC